MARFKLKCENCGCSESEKPMCFKYERWCSDNCRKVLTTHELPSKINIDKVNREKMITPSQFYGKK